MPKHGDTDKNLKKTNAMRALDAAGISYEFHTLDCGQIEQAPSGVEVAAMLAEDPDRVFKTLVTQGKSGQHYVFMIPAPCELDLKKAAAVVDEKSVAMVRSRELLGLTGYVHGGCSPLGMKKPFPTAVDEMAQLHDTVYFSAGRVGAQIEASIFDLAQVVDLTFADLTA